MTGEREVVRFPVQRNAPSAIVLVGSRADGVSRPGSDWDLYVLLADGAKGAPRVEAAPAELAGEHLAVGLVRLPVRDDEILPLFGPNLQQSRVLLDDERGTARALCERARQLYAAGRGLSAVEIERRRHELARNLARMRARSDRPGAFFEAVTFFSHLAHRAWFEVLHDRWSLSVQRALPEIERVDPGFHRELAALVETSAPGPRIAAAEALFARLFPQEVSRRGE